MPKVFLILVIAWSIAVAHAQSGNPPPMIKAADLTPDYKAVKLHVVGEASGAASGLSLLSVLPGSGSMSGLGAMGLTEASWTNGDTTSLHGHEYLITYKVEIGLPPKLGDDTQAAFSLRLTLVRLDRICSIEPLPDLKNTDLVEKLRQMRIVEDAQSVPVSTDGIINVAVMLPVLLQSRRSAQRTVGISNAKQLGLALLMYTNDDWDDVYPYVQATSSLKRLVHPYLKNDKLWDTMSPSGSVFYFNMCLAGVSDSSIERLADTPMLYESKPGPDGKRIVAFADGHVKLVPEPNWQGMQQYLHLKLKKAAKRPLPP